MKKNRLAILIFFLLPSLLQAQESNEELLKWDNTRKLTWTDFKAKPDSESDVAARTTTYLLFSYTVNNEGFSYKIETTFSKSRSWGLHKTAYILSHEQGHFDIAEIFARKLHKKMSGYQFNRKTYQKDLQEIYEEILDEKEEMQYKYDKDTNHSINKEKQAEWLKQIKKLLEEY
jgi:hypothetical protein